MEGIKVAYIAITNQKDGSYLGGIMVVDRRGLPLEFHYTEKVNPTKIQKIIYGDVLGKFIKENVLSENLYKALKSKPDILVLDERDMDAENGAFNLPVICLEPTKAESLKQVKQFKEVSPGQILLQAQGYSHPLMLRFINVRTENQKKVIGKISELSDTMELLEPPVRIREALAEVEKELLEPKENGDDK